MINVWDCQSQSLCGTLISHTQNICKLTVFPAEKKTFPFICGSSSWDGSARCWSEELSPASCLILNSEDSGSCWSVAALGRDSFVTAHADKSIRIWRGDRQVQVISSAHADVVRDLLPLEPNCFVSVGNDGALRVWDASSGTVLQTLSQAHSAFIYGLTRDGNDKIATFGEEGIVKIWKWNRALRQLTVENDKLRIPAMSAWCAVFLDAETLVIGGSNGSFYVFSCLEGSVALESFEVEMVAYESAAQASKSAEIEKNAQDESVLRYPGERIGKTVLVRRSEPNANTSSSPVIEAHQWDGAEWQNLGKVIDPMAVASPDFTFKVQLDDTGRSYDLPYNRGENPYTVAKNFLERNDLPISHLDEVANFIVKNSGGGSAEMETDSQTITTIPVEPENLVVDAFNAEGVLSKMKSFGFESQQITLEDVKQLLKTWPQDRLYPCLDWLRIHVLKTGDTSYFNLIPFDEILDRGTAVDSSKEMSAAVTMVLRLLCNAPPSHADLCVKVIGKCSQSPGCGKWISLLLGLLYNYRNSIDSTKKMVLLQGILARVTSLPCPCDVNRVYWLIRSAGSPIPLTAALKKETDRISDLKIVSQLFE